ncbi:knotted, putative [Trichomonas vaginalis G3]|uniref:Knotted, putative n=1 Tax=Trichomonas vaginalis (strain ATCC PRA-98 / G3) TaxID=412133 RepID=A2E450_TRIV3|nr:homeobox protein transcription factors family [Trichomonas vaginalis G3]EAY12593.1 knotted, putative [Trichomonas vaginalis G3]KAI5509378.1 homeobox protein transcription factors family [Trichomonas vaginalis G3]|eukprot:XP_001324816.1 knotted [Trichomonas vaginalis G3]
MIYDEDVMTWDYQEEIEGNNNEDFLDSIITSEENQYSGENYMNLQIENTDNNCIDQSIDSADIKHQSICQILYNGVQIIRIVENEMKNENPPRKSPINDRISSQNRQILFNWLFAHQQNPYPKLADFIDLEYKTGLGKKRIQTFFINYRARLLKRAPRGGIINQLVTTGQ